MRRKNLTNITTSKGVHPVWSQLCELQEQQKLTTETGELGEAALGVGWCGLRGGADGTFWGRGQFTA